MPARGEPRDLRRPLAALAWLTALSAFALSIADRLRLPDADPLVVEVGARRWSWSAEYPSLGKSCQDKIVLPAGRWAVLDVASEDVSHALLVPALGLRADAFPGVVARTAVRPAGDGTHDLACAEGCGRDHARMRGKVQVLEDFEWEAWKRSSDCPRLDPEAPDYGQRLYERYCAACHSTDGSRGTGPTFLGLFGRTETLTTGESVTVDREYFGESVLEPDRRVVRGFASAMPTFRGRLAERDIAAIADFVESLGGGVAP